MKRFFAFILVLSVCLTLCACGSEAPKKPDGTPVSTEYREMEFVVYDREISSDKYGTDYYMELENEEFRILLSVDAEFYLTYRIGDIVKCEFRPENDGNRAYYCGHLKLDGHEYYAYCVIVF